MFQLSDFTGLCLAGTSGSAFNRVLSSIWPRCYLKCQGYQPMIKNTTNRDETQAIQAALIAPCGMNCCLCRAFLRARNRCPGCWGADRGKPKTRVQCRIKTCQERRQTGGDFCLGCPGFPCERLRSLDQRYRRKYGMSMIENLRNIAAGGLAKFIQQERARWICPGCGAVLCVHEPACLVCQRRWREPAV